MLKRIFIIISLTTIFWTVTYSQSTVQRQARLYQLSQKYQSSDIDKLLDSVNISIGSDPEKAFDFIEIAMILSMESRDRQKQAKTLSALADYYKHYGQYDLAAVNYEESAKLFDEKNPLYFQNYLSAAHYYYNAGNNSKSIDIYKLLTNKTSDEKKQLVIMEGLGDNYFEIDSMELSLSNFYKADSLSLKISDIDKNTEIKLKIGKVLTKLNDRRALHYLNKANTQSNTTSNMRLQFESQNQIADYYSNNNMYREEIQHRSAISNTMKEKSALFEKQNIDVDKEIFRNNILIARILNLQKQPGEALEYINRSKELEQNDIGIELKIEAAKEESESYAELGQDDKAIETYKSYVTLVDELYKIKEKEINQIKNLTKKLNDNQNRIDFLEQDKKLYDVQMQSMEKDQLLKSKSLKYQRNLIILLFVVVLLLVFALFNAYMRIRIQKKHNLFLDLKSLRSQMNPHFIFNALNSVNSFIARNDELNANKYLTRFSKLIRSILENSECDFIPLSDEIELLKSYIELENIRFADKFSYSFHVDDNINIDDFRIPPMLIQPYIENAIWHGLRYKEDSGWLKVDMKKEGSELRIEITDNGIGRKRSMELKTDHQKKNKSKGINNTMKRTEILNKLYNKNISIKIADLGDNAAGTRVLINLPTIKS